MDAETQAIHFRWYNLALWLGVLLAPTAWLLQLCLVYVLSTWVCDYFSVTSITVAGALWLILVVLGVGFTLLAARKVKFVSTTEVDDRVRSRMKFMVAFAIMGSGLFCLIIAAQVVPLIILEVCSS